VDEPSVRTEPHPDGVTLIRLARPPLNALSHALLDELETTARTLAADPTVTAVVVAGSDRAFAAGADITEFGTADDAHRIGTQFLHAFDAVAAIPRPVIAAVRGFALGGGLELALACDLRVAADSARLGQPEILLGIIPGGGATQRLPRLIGPARAKEMVWSGRQVRADEAASIGLVDRVVPADDTESTALAWAATFAHGPLAAIAAAKHVIDHGLDGSLAFGLDLEHAAFTDIFRTEDATEGIRSFLEHGPGHATFKGR
jgi:enoyl-CoA hydratase/carnithine racemase